MGKTAIAEGLAQRIAEGDVPKKLRNCRVHTLEMALLVAGTKRAGGVLYSPTSVESRSL